MWPRRAHCWTSWRTDGTARWLPAASDRPAGGAIGLTALILSGSNSRAGTGGGEEAAHGEIRH
jgi:hypothetical protein